MKLISEHQDANLSKSSVMKVRETTKQGRKSQDKKIATQKEELEKEKQTRLRREVITINQVRDQAKKIIPAFELCTRTEADVLRRETTQKLCAMANWTKP